MFKLLHIIFITMDDKKIIFGNLMPLSYLLSKDFKLEVSAIPINYSILKGRAMFDAAF